MHLFREYRGKIILSYQTRSEQLAIDKLHELLEVAPIEDLILILDGYDARAEAIASPAWSVREEQQHGMEMQRPNENS